MTKLRRPTVEEAWKEVEDEGGRLRGHMVGTDNDGAGFIIEVAITARR